jgi:hypothetical protein
MNCYYSNLIEGHDTLPIEIEQALAEDYSNNKQRKELQYEAKPTSRRNAGLMKEG